MIHGALLGLTDDEAYYWVLAQQPALGYAFHPPAVAWVIAAAQSVLGWLLGVNSPALVRLPAALFSAGILALGLRWVEMVLGTAATPRAMNRAGAVLLAFAGLFGASWMMVPDLPLLFGWMLTFVATWELCFGPRPRTQHLAMLGGGVALALLSKYSAVLAAGSAGLSLLIWARSQERRVWMKRGIVAVTLGGILAAVPILVWNAQHEWMSILYQIRDRHSGSSGFSIVRYGRFWAVELLLAGPALVTYAFLIARRARRELASRYVLIWALPGALVFCVQPGWADFKPHWAFVVWLPIAMELAWEFAQDRARGWARAQLVYGWVFLVFGLLMCHVPIVSWMVKSPLQDVTNDMYGWRELPEFIQRLPGDAAQLPVVGSRYQTASQAAFAMGSLSKATLLPRDLKQRDEWLDLGVTDSQGPHWPKLLKPVLFVADHRYTAGPEFAGSRCEKLGRLEKTRGSVLAKWIDVWRCDPAI